MSRHSPLLALFALLGVVAGCEAGSDVTPTGPGVGVGGGGGEGAISGSTVTAVGMAIASTRQGFFKRMIYSGVSMLLGKVIGDEPDNGESVLSKLATTIGGVVRGMRERKAAREEEEEAEAAAANNG